MLVVLHQLQHHHWNGEHGVLSTVPRGQSEERQHDAHRTAQHPAMAVSDSSCCQPWAAANMLTQKCLSLSIYLGVQKLPNFSSVLPTSDALEVSRC